MKVGMNVLLWTGTVTKEHFTVVKQIAEWGFDGMETPIYAPLHGPWTELGKLCDDLGLGRTAVTIMAEGLDPTSEDPASRRGATDHLKQAVDCCVEMGADSLTGPFCAPVGKLVGRPRTDQEWGWLVECLRPAAEHAKAAGVKFSIEALNRFETYALNCASDAVKLIDEIGVEGCGFLFDTFHANIEEKDHGQAIRLAGSRINHVHVSENDRSTPGRGNVPWAEVFGSLHEIGYDGWLVIEAFGQALPEIAAATCIWRRMYQTEEQLACDGLAFIRTMWGARGA